jgi:hypothetical protein
VAPALDSLQPNEMRARVRRSRAQPLAALDEACGSTAPPSDGERPFKRLQRVGEIVMLRPARAGGLIRAGGDIDNQLKTLFDALRAPQSLQEIPAQDSPGHQEDPFFCLLDDDERIANLTVAVDRYLDAPDDRSVHVDVFVKTRRIVGTYGNVSLA